MSKYEVGGTVDVARFVFASIDREIKKNFEELRFFVLGFRNDDSASAACGRRSLAREM